MANYGTPSLLLTGGFGCTVTDSEGREYLDLLAGIAVSSIGHAHPALVDAVTAQVGRIAHTSNLYANPPALALAQRLQGLLPVPSKVFLCNDGATANEAALKIARKHGRTIDPSGGKLEVVAIDGGFHGRTFGALAVTGQPTKQAPFEPLPGPVTFVPFDDVDALRAAVSKRATAAVIVEPVQGEGGVLVPSQGYLAAVRQICTEADALLIIDEVQTGIARTGPWLASVGEGVVGDVITLAKGLGGGLPIGACLATGAAADLFVPGDHGSTFGGNPVSSAAALAVLDVLLALDAPAHVVSVGGAFASAVRSLDDARIVDVRGKGLLRAIQFTEPIAARVQSAAQESGFLLNAVTPDAIRLAPPLVITEDELLTFVEALPRILDAAQVAA
jgi:acetylornithine aminotransferase